MATIVSNPSSTVTLTAVSGPTPSFWLKDPTDPTVNIAINVQSQHDTSRDERATTFNPLGRTRPVVVADTVLGADGRLDLLTFTAADYTALLVMMNRQRVFLLQSPYAEQWYIRLVGQRASSLSAGPAASPYRKTSVSYVEVDAP